MSYDQRDPYGDSQNICELGFDIPGVGCRMMMTTDDCWDKVLDFLNVY
jgi:hypothetical protein